MYLKSIELRNIKCFEALKIEFETDGSPRLWTTLFGENGLGKSTLLQAIGVVLAGPAAIRELMPVADGWVRRDAPYGEITAELIYTEGDALPPIARSGRPKTKAPYTVRFIVTGNDPQRLPEESLLPDRYAFTVPTIVPWSGPGTPKQRENLTKDMKRLLQTAYSEGKNGWLACGYGPFRRLSGGAQQADRILYAERTSARFVTLFREDAALTSATEWLLRLHNLAREGDRESERALEHVRAALASKLFPEPVSLNPSAQSVQLQVGKRDPIPLQDMSDGYRSMLALSIDLLRWLLKAFPNADDPMDCHGVVLIDELDAHLHPKWQREIGGWLCEKFPRIQFIIATHSAFLAQAIEPPELPATVSNPGPRIPGSNIKLLESDGGVIAATETEATENLRVDQIMQTTLFDLDSLYSPKVERKLARHEELHRATCTRSLSRGEQEEYHQLSIFRKGLPSLMTPQERQLERALQEAIRSHQDQLKEIS